ncbi:MAG: hypothetical protein HeimC2_24780 [Candidatus Heimdallarchaeota archaeon LC_2]|nr:MAG: hypothetical protein HeimC2_24780 [Candidatus Heimdallarchaeota archaeon LC_2]
MGLIKIKDPDVDVTQFEDVLFDEVFSDINTPGIWIAKTQEDLEKSKIIVLDGHSTLLEYNQSKRDLPWTAFNELGQYKYQPENIGDGLIIFSHNFYFQFTLKIGNKSVLVESSFDGNSINAIALPMKDVPISQIFDVIAKRIEEAVTSEIRSYGDTIDVKKGKKISIPEAVSMKIGIKLSMMGIGLKSLTPKEITEVEIVEGGAVEQHFEETSSEKKELLSKMPDVSMKKKGAKRKKVAAGAKMDVKAKEVSRFTAGPPPSSASGAGGAEIASTGQTSPPPPPSTPVAPPKVLSPKPAPTPASSKPSAPPPTAKAPTGVPLTDPVILEEEAEEVDESAVFDGLGIADPDDELIATGMEKTESKMTLKYTHTSYFSRMLLNRAYPLVVKINTEEVGVKKTISSIVSGEKISEKEESMILDEEKSVTIRPEFPGCFVVPSEQEVELSDENVEVKFHVTPLALGMLDVSVRFLQAGKTVHSMYLETKVITHRLSRWLATIGASASVVPTMVAFMLNETPAQFMDKRMDNLAPSIGINGLAILGFLTALFLFLSGFVYRMQKPQKSSRSLAFPR